MTLHRLKVPASAKAKRLDHFLSEAELGLTRSQIKNLIDDGRVSVDGNVATKAGTPLERADEIVLEIPAPRKLDLSPKDIGLKILFEDSHLAVLVKPAGISVHPSSTETGNTLVHGLLHQLKSLSSVGGVERPGIVHRLDKGTSGVLVVSKTDEAHQGLSALFKSHDIDRRYLALVFGNVEKKMKSPKGRIETFFGRHPVHRKKMTGKLAEGRKAVTNWKTREFFAAGLTLVECRLETGRTHQIRVHLSELGFPVVGDKLYGDSERLAKALKEPVLRKHLSGLEHQLLHAYRLAFKHPVTGEFLEFEVPPPDYFEEVLEKLTGESK